MKLPTLLSLSLSLFCICAVNADVRLPAILSDHMVLQAQKPVKIWGWADPNEPVRVVLNGQEGSAVAGADGKWQVTLASLSATATPLSLTVSGKNTLTVGDILVGDVWLGSGQSNMEFCLKDSDHGAEDVAASANALIRIFRVPDKTSNTPEPDVEARWVIASPETVPEISAVLYLFGKEIQATQKIPVGLIDSCWGGTSIQAWMRPEYLNKTPQGKKTADAFFDALAHEKENLEAYHASAPYKNWQVRAEKAKADGQPVPRMPAGPLRKGDRKTPYGLYNAMIHPLLPYPVKGILWYQAEKNGRFEYLEYRAIFPWLIRDWRNLWDDPTMPFYFVQLPNYDQKTRNGTEHNWPVTRESQTFGLREPNTAMAVTIDVGDGNNVHPTNKRAVGHRLALIARANTYGENIPWQSPMMQSFEIRGDAVAVKLAPTYGGLKFADGKSPDGFEVAGEDGVFRPAQASIEGDWVIIRSPQVSKPQNARYAWANNPPAPLYSAVDLPAAPFTTVKPVEL